MSKHSTPTRTSLAREALERNKESFQIQNTKQGFKTASKKQMMFSINKNVLLKAEFLHGFPLKPKTTPIKFRIHTYLISLRWFDFWVDSFAFQENEKWMLYFIPISYKIEQTRDYFAISLLKICMFVSHRCNAQNWSQNAYNQVQGLKNPRVLKMIQSSSPWGVPQTRFLYKVSQSIISCYMQFQGHTTDA